MNSRRVAFGQRSYGLNGSVLLGVYRVIMSFTNRRDCGFDGGYRFESRTDTNILGSALSCVKVNLHPLSSCVHAAGSPELPQSGRLH